MLRSRSLGAATREDVELLDEWGPDVVVFDWQFIAAPVAAERAGIPAVALVHCPYPFPARGAPPLFSGQKPMGGPLGAAREGPSQCHDPTLHGSRAADAQRRSRRARAGRR